MPTLHTRYQPHVHTYGQICDKHGLRFVPLASAPLASCIRTRPSSFTRPFISDRKGSTQELVPHATPCSAGRAERSTRLRLLLYCVPAVSLPEPRVALSAPAAPLPRRCCVAPIPDFSRSCLRLAPLCCCSPCCCLVSCCAALLCCSCVSHEFSSSRGQRPYTHNKSSRSRSNQRRSCPCWCPVHPAGWSKKQKWKHHGGRAGRTRFIQGGFHLGQGNELAKG